MNKLFKTLTLGFLMAFFAIISAEATYAQCDDANGKRTLYNKFIENYDKGEAQQKVALEAGKEYITKYGSCEADAEQVAYLKDTGIPYVETSLKKYEDDRIAAGKKKEKDALYTRFNTGVKDKNVGESFSAGKQILSSEPDFLDVYIVLATMGYDEAVKKNNTYNNDAIEYAKKAIQLIESGKTSKEYGALTYVYKTKEFSTPEQAKNNALGWLNYSIGSIMFFNQDKKKEALPYLYKATQFESGIKKAPAPYRLIGDYFTSEVARIDKERTTKIAANNNEDNDETLALLALEKAYADRAMDAYARAYKIASTPPEETKEYKDSLYTLLKNLYNFRFNNTDGLDAYVASVMSKPMPNPTTEITPVVEAKTTTTTTSTTTTTTPSTKTSATTSTTPATVKTKSDGTTPAEKAKTTTGATTPTKKTTPQRKRQR